MQGMLKYVHVQNTTLARGHMTEKKQKPETVQVVMTLEIQLKLQLAKATQMNFMYQRLNRCLVSRSEPKMERGMT